MKPEPIPPAPMVHAVERERRNSGLVRRLSHVAVVSMMTVGLVAWLYLASALYVFDFTETAFPYDEDNRDGQPVAMGPRPRTCLCYPAYDDINYEHDQWPFVVYQPICTVWNRYHGYVDGYR